MKEIQDGDRRAVRVAAGLHVPMRMCIICRVRAPKNQMRRYVRDAEGQPVADNRLIMPGRGFYVCGKPSCLEKMTMGKRRKRCKGEMHVQ